MADPISKSAGRFVTFGQGRFVLRWGQHQCYALFNPTKDVARTSDRVKKYGKVVVGYFPTLREGLAAAVLASFAADNRTINYRELNQFLRQLCQQILSDARWDQQKAIPSTAAGGIANHNEELASTPF